MVVSVQYLVEKGADMELSNRHGHTPLMIASFREKTDVVKYLLDMGADPSKASRKGWSLSLSLIISTLDC